MSRKSAKKLEAQAATTRTEERTQRALEAIKHGKEQCANTNALENASKKLRVLTEAKRCGIGAGIKTSLAMVLCVLLNLPFLGLNLWRYLHTDRGQADGISKNVYYRLLESPKANWRKLVLTVGARIVELISRKGAQPEDVPCLVLDDSIIDRPKAKKVELVAMLHDHVVHKCKACFAMLALLWTNGRNSVCLHFNMCSSTRKKVRIQEADPVDRRTVGWRNRQDAQAPKPESAIKMVKEALAAGVHAQYVLADSWFTTSPMIAALKKMGLDMIGVVRKGKTRYRYRHNDLTIEELAKHVRFSKADSIYGALIVTDKRGTKLKMVFVRNWANPDKYLVIISTDISLSNEEIIRIYGFRWNIELFFKASKSLLNLGKEFQPRSYDAVVSTTALAVLRFNILAYILYERGDGTIPGLFYDIKDDMSHEAELVLQAAMDYALSQVEFLVMLCDKFFGLLSKLLRILGRNNAAAARKAREEIICFIQDVYYEVTANDRVRIPRDLVAMANLA